MNTIDELIARASGAAGFAQAYIRYLSTLLGRLDVDTVGRIAEDLAAAHRDRAGIFIVGNGGSAATAGHMVNDLVFGTRSGDDRRTLCATSLTDGISLLTAIANDVGFDDIFVRQLQNAFRPGDRLIVISASGNSPNILKAAKWVNEQGGRVIGLLGFDGGAVRPFCHEALVIATPAGEYGPVEDAHLVVNHILTVWLKHCIRAS